MTRRSRLIRNGLIVITGLIVLLVAGTVLVVHTAWFGRFAKQMIISTTEESTGGKVEIGSFSFDATNLRAVLTDFVIHGEEPAGAQPFVRVARLQVDLQLFAGFRRLWEIAYLDIEHPEVNVIRLADGRTNIPNTKRPSKNTAFESVVDLAVKRFELRKGAIELNSLKQGFNLRGNNLNAKLYYNFLAQSYQGLISLEPQYTLSGRNTPVRLTMNLPVVLKRDRIDLQSATITTPTSNLTLSGSVEDLRDPKVSGDLHGGVSLVDLRNFLNGPQVLSRQDENTTISIDAIGTIANGAIEIAKLRTALGRSTIEASGMLRSTRSINSLRFKASLALDELQRLADIRAHLGGTMTLDGDARLHANNSYEVTARLEAIGISFRQGDYSVSGIDLSSGVHVDPQRLVLDRIRLNLYGGQFDGNASLQEFARYKLGGNIRGLGIQPLLQAVGRKVPYSGTLAGPVSLEGDFHEHANSGMIAQARIAIAPGKSGIPVSGRLNADYDGARGDVALTNSFIALPQSRLNLNGSLAHRLTVSLTTRNLDELLAASDSAGKPKVALSGGTASFNGTITGSARSPQIAGQIAMDRIVVEGRRFNTLAADVAASSSNLSLRNGVLTRGLMEARGSGTVGLVNWRPTAQQPLSGDLSIRGGDLADILAIAGQPSAGYSGALNAEAHVAGTVGNPAGNANVEMLNGTALDEPFERAGLQVKLSDQLISVPSAYLESPAGRLSLTAEFHHPRESVGQGQLNASVQSTPLKLGQVHSLRKQWPNTAGTAQLSVNMSGVLTAATAAGKQATEFVLSKLDGDVSAKGIAFNGQQYGDLDLAARTNGSLVSYNATSNFAGSTIRVGGNSQLVSGYPSEVDLSIAELPVERVLALTKQGIPATGRFSATAHLSGPVASPQGRLDLSLANATLYDERFDRVRAQVSVLPQRIDLSSLEVAEGPNQMEASGQYDHPAGDLSSGKLQFQVKSNGVDLARIRCLRAIRTGIGGNVQLDSSGSATIRPTSGDAHESPILFSSLNAKLTAKNISVQGNHLGDIAFNASTNSNRIRFTLDSNLAGALFKGRGDAEFKADYPFNAELSFQGLTYAALRQLLGPRESASPSFEAATDGRVTLNGSAMHTDQMKGALQLTRLQVNSSAVPARTKSVTIMNQGPVLFSADRGLVRIESARLVGPGTDIQLGGTITIPTKALNVTAKAEVDLGILQALSADIYSAGHISLAATVRGSVPQPLMNGKLELKDASFSYTNFPNTISKANGALVFNGNSASMRDFTAESGGGKLTATGFVRFADTVRFGLRAKASEVRIPIQQGLTVVAEGDVRISGTGENSLVSGTAQVNRVSYAPQSDLGSLLSNSGPSDQIPREPSPLLDGMKLDLRVRTSPSLTVQAQGAQNLQAEADLRVRGSASQPSVLGRVLISEGRLAFFGSTFTVNSGTISFYNPARIEPILNINLETVAQGVDVILTVTGPVNNMKLSYTSDPPLQFQEIVALLASGRTPTSDPTLLASQPSAPTQGFQQMGESAIVSRALADPISNRLKRVFGVSQFKIDPSFASGSQVPDAHLTLQQQITSNVTFTYTSALSDPNSTLVRVEWAFNPRWSAVATRDQNGIVSLNFFYKRQFR